MSYDQKLEELILVSFQPNNLLQNTSEDAVNLLLQKLDAELVLVKESLVTNVFSFTNSQMAEVYVQFQQKVFNQYLQRILSYDDEPEARSNWHLLNSIYELVSRKLESILDFILQSFTQYFDVDQPITESYRKLTTEDLQNGLKTLRQAQDHVIIDKNVIELITECLEEMLDSETAITYRQLKYAREVIDHVVRLVSPQGLSFFDQFFNVVSAQLNDLGIPEKDLTVKLHMLLLYLNVNCRPYIDYCISMLYFKMKDKTVDEKLGILKLYDKLMDQLAVKPQSIWIPNDLSAKQQIKNWIIAETKELQTGADNKNGPAKVSAMAKVEKIKLGISSSQLAVWVKVLLHIGFLIDENESKIYRTFSQIFITPGADNLSSEGLRSKASRLRPNAISSVIDMLINGYNNLRSIKF